MGKKGFTIVELIVVIAVIAILAGIIIVSYGAWRHDVRTGVVKNDLSQAIAAIESSRTWSTGSQNGYSSGLPPGVTSSENVTLSGGGRPGGTTFCITAQSTEDSSIVYYISDKQSTPKEGTCAMTAEKVIDSTVQFNQWGVMSTGYGSRIGGITTTSDGTVYVSGGIRQGIARFDPSTRSLTTITGSGIRGYVDGAAQQAQFRDMGGTVPDGRGGFYQADGNNNRVRYVAPDGTVSTVAQVHQASGIALDSHGNLYVSGADSSQCDNYVEPGQRISKITPNGTVSTYAGNGICGIVNGPAATAQFKEPGPIAIAPDGTLYVIENSCAIRKISPSGIVSTIAGTEACATTPVDGVGTAATFREIGGIVVDKRGNLYIADHSRIRVMTPDSTVSTLVVNSELGRPGKQITIDPEGNLWGLGDLGGYAWKLRVP